ncbi:MAG: histidinol-phosphatase [Erysipelotrichaceae bacterium]|nr:histidinol-phosphatase [Erysipelotrichaceae bacterium]MDY5252592.1 histidinol-phosphatase [Erysipelotrichaceae bacterium]
MLKQNLHTHTTYCDGQDSPEAMIETAIEKKFAILGFSSHGPNEPYDDHFALAHDDVNAYVQHLQQLKHRYASQIKIYCGIEEDAIGRKYDHHMFDYIIGSVHMVETGNTYKTIDHQKDLTLNIINDYYHHDFLAFAQNYFKQMDKLIADEQVDIIGHFDLLTKFNEDEMMIAFDDPAYLNLCFKMIDKIIAHDKIFEVNTGAIARGYRSLPYPHPNLLRYIASQNGKLLLNSDCHDRRYLDCYYDPALLLIKQCGFKEWMILTDEGFKKTAI